VLECGGIELILRCANLRLWPDTVTIALWNICAESDVEVGLENITIGEDSRSEKQHIAVEREMSTIACRQLALRSTGECDDSNGASVLAAEIGDARRHKNIIKELLEIADLVKNETVKELVAELLEKASWQSKSTT
jgi:hypothetical protein